MTIQDFIKQKLNRLICKVFNHKVCLSEYENGFDKITKHTCQRCGSVLDTETHQFDIKCILSGKLVWARICKENSKTVHIKYKDSIIRRHKNKHNVAIKLSGT